MSGMERGCYLDRTDLGRVSTDVLRLTETDLSLRGNLLHSCFNTKNVFVVKINLPNLANNNILINCLRKTNCNDNQIENYK